MKSIINILVNKIKIFFNIDNYEKKLDNLEKEPIFFGQPNQNIIHLDFLKKMKDIPISGILKQKLLALQYRLEIIPLKFQRPLFDLLAKEAKIWKQKQSIIPIKDLNLNDLKEIEKVAYHGQYASLVLENEEVRDLLFNWILRDQNDAIVFIQFPSLINRMNSSNLNGRLSCHGGHLLKVQKQKVDKCCFQKIVTLPFEGRPTNILDESKVIDFRGNVSKTIGEIFDIFKGKDFKVGDFEFMSDGIINWNIHHLGFWDEESKSYTKVDLEKPEWWKQLPFFEVLTLKQVKMRYGWSVNGSTWIAAASATRGLASLSYEQTHAFLELAIPIGKGLYGIYDFGKLAYKYPSSFLETMDMFCKNVHATIAFPDENVFYSHRQHALHPFCLNSEQGFKIMELIKRDIEVARAYNLVYQIESENCAKWVQLKLEAVLGNDCVPNLYRMQLLNTEPEGPVSKIFACIKKLPEKWQVPLLTTLHLPLGAAKKTWIEENGVLVAKSLKDHSFFNTGEVYLPAFMHDQLLRGSLKCPLGLHDAYFAVGILSDKHKFGFVQKQIEERERFMISKDSFFKFLKTPGESTFLQESFTPLKL